MKRIFPYLLIACLILVYGCGSNNPLTNTDDEPLIETRVKSIRHLAPLPEDAGVVRGFVYNEINEQPLSGVSVYAHDGVSNTSSSITDENGFYSLYVPYDTLLTLNYMKNQFETNSTEEIQVAHLDTYEVSDIYMFPATDEVYAAVEGDVYFDAQQNNPVEGASILIFSEDDETTDCISSITDEDGHYIVEFIPAGTFEIYAVIENNFNGTSFTVSNDQQLNMETITTEDIILQNTPPVVTYYTQINEVLLPMSEEEPLFLEVIAHDVDGDYLTCQWSMSGGYMDISTNTETLWMTENVGTHEVKVVVSDLKGGETEHSFFINAHY